MPAEGRDGNGSLGAADLEQLAEHGIPAEEARRQLALLRDPPAPVELVAPCTVGDGIERLSPEERRRGLDAWHAAARAGRITKFVPASGAASRMFASLSRVLDCRESGASENEDDRDDLERFLSGLPDLALHDGLASFLRERGIDLAERSLRDDPVPLLRALLIEPGLGYADLPKALIPFHREGTQVRTALAEHLAEARDLVADANGRCRVHVTVAPGAEALFERHLAAGDAGLDVTVSRQGPATDTLAIDSGGRPVRASGGRLLLRPGGHGALLRNLDECDADLVVVKNIDNIQPAAHRAAGVEAQRILLGRLAEVQETIFGLVRRLEANAPGATDAARDFIARTLARTGSSSSEALPSEPAALVAHLRRPLRVCGMVPNTGDPGGGPFWTRGSDGRVTRQIVETSEISAAEDQRAILAAASHFNPVLLALGLRDPEGREYELGGFADPHRAFVTRKTFAAREVLALEHPGLWNGAMARWNTLFVEVPRAAFSPVKTVLDLLSSAHRT